MRNCNCSLGLANSGVPGCQPIQKVARKLIIVPMFQDDGTANEIDLVNDTLDSTYFLGKRDNVDSSLRWYPTPKIDNVEDTRDEPITESLNSGKSIFIQDGPRTFTGVFVDQYSTLLDKIEDYGCSRIGVYIVDKDGNLIGNGGSEANKLKPIEIDGETWNPTLMKATDTTIGKVQLTFQFEQDEQDRNLRMIAPADMDNYNLLNLNGLIDVYGRDLSTTSTTELSVSLFALFGSLKANGDYSAAVEGLGVDDIVVRNVTSAADVTPSGVTEDPAGNYVLTFAAQTSADELKVKVDKSGFSAEYVKDTAGTEITFTVP